MNVNDFDRLYKRRLTGTGVTGSPVYLSLDRVDAKRIRTLSHITVENKTLPFTKLRLSIYDGSTDHYIAEFSNPFADQLLVHQHDVLLGEGDILRAILTGTTDGDILELFAIGWEQERKA